MFIYLDESGDLGFDFSKNKTSKKFVITLLVCHTQSVQKDFKKAVRRTLKNKLNKKKSENRRIVELKGTNTVLSNKQYFFRHVKNSNWDIYSVVLNKERVHSRLQTRAGKNKLYNFLARFIIEKPPLRRTYSNVRLVVDKSKNRDEIKDFNRYIKNQIESLLPLNTALRVDHLNSQNDPGLQSVDLFCWGIFRKYEFGDDRWYKSYQHKIKYITEYLPDLSV